VWGGRNLLAYVLQGFVYGFGAGAQPGPFQMYVISLTLRNGWRRALPAAFAPLVSDAPIVLSALFLLTRLPDRVEFFLSVAGGLFVLYLAWGAWKSCQSFDETAIGASDAAERGILKAALVNLLNPGPYLYWGLVSGPILVTGWREAHVRGIGFLCAFYGALVATTAVVIVVFGTVQRLGPKVARYLLGASAILLAGFGILQIWRGLSGL